KEKFEDLKKVFNLEKKQQEVKNLDNIMAQPEFWNDLDKAQKVSKKAQNLKDEIEDFKKLESIFEDLDVAIELSEEDSTMMEQVDEILQVIEKKVDEFQLKMLLSGKYDHANAFLTIHPGAGGTESQDWASMLLRMYIRWAEKNGYEIETLDYQDGEEAGIKSATIKISGLYVYGKLKYEKGVHRLVRISPFDANGRRHTSFASVSVVPEIDDDIEIEIRPEDLRIDTYRSGGAGGQHVNKTDSAVRITHIPTGIVVAVQSERSQHQNKANAMRMLRAKLLERRLEEQQQELAALRGEVKEIAWGSQIRSYVFHPYSMVKDHRTDVEVGNVHGVMDGDLDIFIDAYLRSPHNW